MATRLTQAIVPFMRGYVVVPGSGGALDAIFYGEAAGRLVAMARYDARGSEVVGVAVTRRLRLVRSRMPPWRMRRSKVSASAPRQRPMRSSGRQTSAM